MCFASPVDRALIDGSFYSDEGARYHLSPEKIAGDFSPVRFQRELALFRRHCRSGAVLDVGCSTGAFLHQLRQRYREDYTVTGMDISGPAVGHARSLGLAIEPGVFDQHDFGTRRFEAVTFWAVLEHLLDPSAFVAKAAELLTPGGHCFILVPNLDSLAFRLLGSRYRYVMPEHVNYFNARSLEAMTASVPALRIVEACSTHFNPMVIWQDGIRARSYVPPEERARLLVRSTAWKTNRLLTPLRWAYAATEALLGRLGLADNCVLVLRRG